MKAQSVNSSPVVEAPSGAGLGKRIHAWMLAHLNARYERMVAARKRALFADLRGTILEIGPGTGPNLQYYASGIHWIGIEPNPYMYPYLRNAAERVGLRGDLRMRARSGPVGSLTHELETGSPQIGGNRFPLKHMNGGG